MHTTEPTTDTIERRLQQWAAWLCCSQKSSGGFPCTNVLHPSWMPPTPGSRPTLKAGGQSDRQEIAMHNAVSQLSIRLRNTLVVVYVQKLSVADRELNLSCQASTIRARVAAAKAALAGLLDKSAQAEKS